MEHDGFSPQPLAVAVADLVAAVTTWPGVTVHEHPYGGYAFNLGAREFAHVHRSGLVDVNYHRRVRDALVDAGRTGRHPVHPDSGWTSYRLRDAGSVDGAVWLLRLAYLATAISLSRTETGKRALAGLDLETELAVLDPPAVVRRTYRDRATALGILT